MFDDALIESSSKHRDHKGRAGAQVISAVVHVLLVGGIIAAGYYIKENPDIIEKPIQAFMVAAAPPPPPPPPPPAASTSTPKTTPKIEVPKTEPTESFVTPTETPMELPQVDPTEATDAGVEGGVVGGVEGGVVGGTVGGVIGGVIGGTLGGQLGGEIGGTGDMPVRVGGDVKAPIATTKVDPLYTEVARKARIQGTVIVEAVIDRNGNVTDVRVLKPLPMGLDQEAMNAVRKWHFKPGTLNGRPVPVIFILTVNFRLQQ